MNQKMVKIFSIFLVIIMMLSVIAPVFAAGEELLKPNGVTPTVNQDASKSISDFGGQIVGTLQTIGTVIAIVILVVLGIKYMIGSPEEKSEYKKTMIPYLIGAVLIFAAVTIANIVYNFTTSFNQAG